MQKVVLSIFFTFLLFGMLLHAPLVLAQENETNETNDSETSVSSSATVTTGNNESDDDKNETKNDSRKYQERLEMERKRLAELRDKEMRERQLRQKEILKDNGCFIKIERTIKKEGNVITEIIRKERVCPNGERQEVKVRLSNETENGTVRSKIKYEFRGEELEVQTSEGVNVEEDVSGEDYHLRARLKSGESTDIKIMPDRASEIALERLRAKGITIELKEVGQEGTKKVVYVAKVYKDGKFIGIIKKKVKIETEIDPETGEVTVTRKPWWAFFVAGEDSDQSDDDDNTTGTDNETQPSNDTNDDETPAVNETPTENNTNSS